MRIKMLFCLLTLLYAAQGVCATLPTQFQFRHYNIENGMSSNSVTDIIQDQKGYIWMSTDGGLICFDGTSFSAYQKGNPHHPALHTNIIHALCEADEDMLWLGTDIGIYIYNTRENHIVRFDRITDDGTSVLSYINQMRRDRKGRIWIATLGSGVFCYDPQTGRCRSYRHSSAEPAGLDSDYVPAVVADSSGDIWCLASGGNLHRYDSIHDCFTGIPIRDDKTGAVAKGAFSMCLGWGGETYG